MSFILDALKKSESARQRRLGPSLADAPAVRRRSERPWWALALAALLVLNLGVLIVAITRDRSPASPVETAAAPAQSPPHSAATPGPVTPGLHAPAPQTSPPSNPARSPAMRSLADEAAAARPTEVENTTPPPGHAAAAAVPQRPPIVRPIEATGARVSTPTAATAADAPSLEEVLPTHSELVAGGMNLPDMHLDIHVHSSNAAERFVFVNMRKYMEGQALREGPTLERITPDGAVLNHQGLRFLLSRN